MKALLGIPGASAAPVAGSASAEVVAQLAVLRAARTAADELPASTGIGPALAAAGAASYDPSAAILLTGDGPRGGVYAVPALLSQARVLSSCDADRDQGLAARYLAVKNQEVGNGPGVCLVTTQLVTSHPETLTLPGAPKPKALTKLEATHTRCASLAVLDGYGGPLGDLWQEPAGPTLIPDGVSQVTYTLQDGRAFVVPVSGNLATPPAELGSDQQLNHPSNARLTRLFAAHLPISITETAADGSPLADLAPPASLVADEVGATRFLQAVLTSGLSTSSSSSAGSGASCSSRTHRCVAVVVTLTCGANHRCQTARVIHRYRYVGNKPPRGTTGPDTQDTAPVVGKIDRFISHPGKLSLVLRGAAQRRVTVLVTVDCATRNASVSSPEPPLTVAVPSRTPIALPGRAGSFQSCQIGALATSHQKDSVHLIVARS